MIKIEVRGMEAVQRRLRNLSREMQDKVLQPAINKTAEKARAEINLHAAESVYQAREVVAREFKPTFTAALSDALRTAR